MKILNFNPKERWRRVEDELYFVWVGNQSGAILPRWQDTDFKKSIEYVKKQYSLKDCEKYLRIY